MVMVKEQEGWNLVLDHKCNMDVNRHDQPQPEPKHQPVLEPEIDPIWLSSRTARQIYALGEVDKVGFYYFLPLSCSNVLCAHRI